MPNYLPIDGGSTDVPPKCHGRMGNGSRIDKMTPGLYRITQVTEREPGCTCADPGLGGKCANRRWGTGRVQRLVLLGR